MLIYILFIAGFYLLIKGADILVAGSCSIARKYNISEMVIGLTIVSFGTSMPELIVNVISSLSGSSDIAIGNVIGSNISNILLILGVTAMICELPLRKSTILSDIPFSLAAAMLVGFLANASFSGEDKNILSISQLDGMILLIFFALFMVYIYTSSKSEEDVVTPVSEDNDEPHEETLTMKKSLVFIIAGMTGLFLGGKWVVDGAVHIATLFGMSKSFIGLTVVAVGTSLPELVTSVIAATKKSTDIAVGNVIGSNIFNLLWILGISASINPLDFNKIANDDILMLIFSSALMLFAVIVGKKKYIDRWMGGIFFLVYVAYTVFLINRETPLF